MINRNGKLTSTWTLDKYENVRLFPRSVFRRQRSRPMRVLWAPERRRCGRDSRGKRKLSLAPHVSPFAPRFLAPSMQAKFFWSAHTFKKDLVRYKVPIF